VLVVRRLLRRRRPEGGLRGVGGRRAAQRKRAAAAALAAAGAAAEGAAAAAVALRGACGQRLLRGHLRRAGAAHGDKGQDAGVSAAHRAPSGAAARLLLPRAPPRRGCQRRGTRGARSAARCRAGARLQRIKVQVGRAAQLTEARQRQRARRRRREAARAARRSVVAGQRRLRAARGAAAQRARRAPGVGNRHSEGLLSLYRHTRRGAGTS
jgi:hypothetical protein